MYNVKERAPRLMEEEGSRGKSQKSTDANWRFRPGRVIKVSDPPSTHNLKFYLARNRSCCFLPLFFAGIALVAAILRRRDPGTDSNRLRNRVLTPFVPPNDFLFSELG